MLRNEQFTCDVVVVVDEKTGFVRPLLTCVNKSSWLRRLWCRIVHRPDTAALGAPVEVYALDTKVSVLNKLLQPWRGCVSTCDDAVIQLALTAEYQKPGKQGCEAGL